MNLRDRRHNELLLRDWALHADHHTQRVRGRVARYRPGNKCDHGHCARPSAPDVPSGAGTWMKDQVATLMHTYGARFDVNCSILFTELPLTRRAAAAGAAGFGGVEFWWPWQAMAPSDAEADAFVGSVKDAAVELVSLNFHTGDTAAGSAGSCRTRRGRPTSGRMWPPRWRSRYGQGAGG